MPSPLQRHISTFRTIVLAGVTATLVVSAALPLRAQNSVPPTARQAATMPQFAAKLAHGASRVSHPAPPRASYKRPPNAFAQTKHGWLPQDNEIYDNGPVNGTTDAWTIGFGFVVSDTFTVPSGGGTVTGVNFYAWTFPGDVLQNAEIAITSSEFGGTTYTDQIVSFSQSGCSANQYGFNVCLETSSGMSPVNLTNAGTYWVNLENAVVNDGDPLYWDENSGPSLASENAVGTIPSESFTVLGEATTSQPPPTCYQSGGNLQIIAASGVGGNGLVIDKAGNLYGTNGGGQYLEGYAYKLAHPVDWVLDPLFSFFGGYNGGPPFGAIVGPNGTLYGGAQGGIQNCSMNDGQYCGVVYNLTPQPTACTTALCSWKESVPYRFTSEMDGSYGGFGGINVSAYDQQGNLYGTTYAGGSYGAGTVFELTPSAGGWTKTTLYSFTGGNDGANPQDILVGTDGNLYGAANGGGMYNFGAVFQLTPSSGQWTETVIYAFDGFDGAGENPAYLIEDGAGNLYGIVNVSDFGAIFTLQKAGSGWVFSEYQVMHDNPLDQLNNLTGDAAGNLYGTGLTAIGSDARFDGNMLAGGRGNRTPAPIESHYIFEASYSGGSWHYEEPVFLYNTYFSTGGSLAVDSSGNLYGTTSDCGINGSGTVWQLSP